MGDVPRKSLHAPQGAIGEYDMARQNRNRVGIPKVTDEQIAAMANTGISDASTDQTVAERSGSDDKVAAVAAEGAKPKVKTFTPEGLAWMDRDPYGLKTAGLYGQRGKFAIRPSGDNDHPGDLTRRAQFLGRPLTVADMEEIHRPDEKAPTTADCTTCGQAVTSFIKTAMIDEEGDLRRDQNGNVTYRGQAVITGKPLARHAAHTGDCLYQLRNARNKKKQLPNGKWVADLLPSQSFDQADARLAGIEGYFAEKANEKQAMQNRLGFKVGDAARHSGGNRTDDGIDRGSYAPKTPRGQIRKQQRWTQEDA